MVEVVVVTAVDAVFEHTSRDVDTCRGRSTGSIGGGGGTGCRTSDGVVVVEAGKWILLHIRLLLPLLDGNTNINSSSSSSSRSGGNGIALCLLIVWSSSLRWLCVVLSLRWGCSVSDMVHVMKYGGDNGVITVKEGSVGCV